jgi:hypothetical protein
MPHPRKGGRAAQGAVPATLHYRRSVADVLAGRDSAGYRATELEYGGGVGQVSPHGGREIKDVVSLTGLWLVVRERIDGVGKTGWKGVGRWICARNVKRLQRGDFAEI